MIDRTKKTNYIRLKTFTLNIVKLVMTLTFSFVFTISIVSANEVIKKDKGTRIEQRNAIKKIGNLSKLKFNAHGMPSNIEGELGYYNPATHDKDINKLIKNIGAIYHLQANQSFKIRRVNNSSTDYHTRLDLYVNHIKVEGAEFIIHTDNNNNIYAINGNVISSENLAIQALITQQQALNASLDILSDNKNINILDQPKLIYVVDALGGAHLSWLSLIEYKDNNGSQYLDKIYIDATNAQFIMRTPQIHNALDREIRSAGNQDIPLGTTTLISEGGSSSDTTAMDVYEHLKTTYDYFNNKQGIDSFDDNGTSLKATIHYVVSDVGQPDEKNIGRWDSNNKRFLFGDGDDSLFSSLGRSLDIVAHEYTHEVSNEIGPTFIYQQGANGKFIGESGGVSEALSDVFATAVDIFKNGQTSNTWLLAEDVWKPAVSGDAMRYMNNPTKDNNSLDFYLDLTSNTEVHDSSGIINLAYYLLVNGGFHPQGRTSHPVETGVGHTKAENIFFQALTQYMTSAETFIDAMEHTARVALQVHGNNSNEHKAVCAAWSVVGIPNDSSVYCASSLPNKTTWLNKSYSCSNGGALINTSWGIVNGSLASGEFYQLEHRNGKYGVWAKILPYSQSTSHSEIYFSGLQYFKARVCNHMGDCGTATSTLVNASCGGGGGDL
jgi:vibriolysin